MLPKVNRLKKKNDFQKVLKEGKTYKENFLVLKLKKNNLKESRFGFIVSRNVSPKATLRNKIKRRLAEIVRTKFKKIKKGVDVLFVARPGLEEEDFWEINDKVERLFKKAKIWNFS